MASYANIARGKSGRGRGRTRPTENLTNQHQPKTAVRSNRCQVSQHARKSPDDKALEFMQQVKREHAKASERALKMASALEYDSSSDEGDLDDDKIITEILKSYRDSENSLESSNGTIGKNFDNLGQTITGQHLHESCRSGAITCLVCISSIKRQDAVWNCVGCFATFHLQCIQRWVREGTAQKTVLSDVHFPNKDIPWYCPKCRFEYTQQQCPGRYYCYCGKEEDPPFDPWLVPHSCGNCCEKLLQPKCGHKCLLLCHPGPCPPCPKVVKTPCFCGKVTSRVVRCGASSWSCGQKCDKLLNCRKHKCVENCHDGECKACQHTATESCICRRNTQTMPCGSPSWKCTEMCNKILPCGLHKCEEVCHVEDCGDCPRSGWRKCPCGKSGTDELPCSEDVQTCDDTCGKSLECYGGHKCMRRCHHGACGPCLMIIEKECRCGKRKREMPCSKEFFCDLKCHKMRNCRNHQCKRKCCDGNCPICEQMCGRSLQCQRHKCQSTCHIGRCYPCIRTSTISCNCGKTTTEVVCGKEKTTKPPRCRKRCMVSPTCHHTIRQPHQCHFGPCPVCTQVCARTMNCGHSCPAACHDEVVVKNEVKAAGPWELPYQSASTVKCLPCPPCRYPVPKHCLGDHEISDMPCFEAKRASCGRSCSRLLKCENHKCRLPCHTVKGALDDVTSGYNCAECEEPCSKSRPMGCTHSCPFSCHSGPCPLCNKRVPKQCHCGIVLLQHVCNEWTTADSSKIDKMRSCGSNCPKLLSCSHFCSRSCHSGMCSAVESCAKKVILKCPCKRRRRDFVCSDVQQGGKVECDYSCEVYKRKADLEKEEMLKKKAAEEEKIRQAEIEKFDRKMQKGSKSRRKKKSNSQDVDGSSSSSKKYLKLAIVVVVLGVLVAFSYNLLSL